MPTIAVIGANGQVGSEITLLLAQMPGVSVAPIVRSEYGASYLRRLGIPCRIGAVARPDDAKRLLEDVDLIADFSLPGGLPAAIRKGIMANVRGVFGAAPARAPYVFMSSTMAFGMPPGSEAYGDFSLARTPYAAQKRFGERFAKGLGLVQRRPVFAFRLGQVHGELQGVSHQVRALVEAQKPLVLPNNGDVRSDVVFCSTIALALRHVADGLDAPGTYTLVEEPDWTLRRLYEHYARDAGVPLAIADGGAVPGRERVSATTWIKNEARAFLSKNQPLLVAQVLPLLAPLEVRVKMQHLARRAAADSAEGRFFGHAAPKHFAGPVPGPRLPSLHDTATLLRREALSVRALLERELGPRSHVFREGL